MTDLDQSLLSAHATQDLPALVQLYVAAADQTIDREAAAFYLTHAHVFAMVLDHPDTMHLRQRLIDQGREAPLPPPIPPFR